MRSLICTSTIPRMCCESDTNISIAGICIRRRTDPVAAFGTESRQYVIVGASWTVSSPWTTKVLGIGKRLFERLVYRYLLLTSCPVYALPHVVQNQGGGSIDWNGLVEMIKWMEGDAEGKNVVPLPQGAWTVVLRLRVPAVSELSESTGTDLYGENIPWLFSRLLCT